MTNVYVFYDDDGNIYGFGTKASKEWDGYNNALIPLELKNEICSGRWDNYKVDLNSKEFKIHNIAQLEKSIDPYKNKLVEIYHTKFSNNKELLIVVKSINNRPHIVINSTHNNERQFEIYLTKQGNPNFLYQQFICETNKEMIFEIDQIDYKKVFKGEFSLFYYKIFESSGYQIL